MHGIRTERGSSALTTIFFANLFMLGVLCALVCINDSVGTSLNDAGHSISRKAASN